MKSMKIIDMEKITSIKIRNFSENWFTKLINAEKLYVYMGGDKVVLGLKEKEQCQEIIDWFCKKSNIQYIGSVL